MFADEGVVSTDPVADFLEFCSLCSNQKEQEEAEGGVSVYDCIKKREISNIIFIESNHRDYPCIKRLRMAMCLYCYVC